MHFTNLLIIMLVALVAPLVVNALPALRLPSPVLEIVAGIVIGLSVLGWVRVDAPVEVLALVGLAFLLFLAGLEIDVHRLRGRPLILALTGFVVSFAIAVGAALALAAGGFTSAPLLVAIILCATSLGLVVPVLKDSGQVASPTGQLIIAAASIADFGAVILLSLFFSEQSTGLTARLLLLAGLAVVVVLLVVALIRAGRSARADRVFQKLMDTTAQIRIRFAMVLLIAFVALAQGLGFEAILGAFLAGAVLRLIDADAATVHPHTELKLDAIGYGFLIPVFFVTSGVTFNTQALFASPSTWLQVPLFLAALFAVRALPALRYRKQLGMRHTMAAGFLQAMRGPPRPELQYQVCDELGDHVAWLDMAYPTARAGVEFDGQHHQNTPTFRADLARHNRLAALGWTVLRASAADVLRNPDRFAALVRAVLRQRAA